MTAPNPADAVALLPCPFCGSAGQMHKGSPNGFYVSCGTAGWDCGMAEMYTYRSNDEMSAAKAWNRRVPATTPVQRAVVDREADPDWKIWLALSEAENFLERPEEAEVDFAPFTSWRKRTYDTVLALLARQSSTPDREADARSDLKIEFYQHDWIPGFAAYLDGAGSKSQAFCVLNLGAMLGAVHTADVRADELPYFIAESMMHEVIHALEKWAGVEFNEQRVEALLERYAQHANDEPSVPPRATAVRALPPKPQGERT